MIRRNLIAFATLALAACGTIPAVLAGSADGPKGESGHSYRCAWKDRLVVVGYDSDGEPIYERKRVRVCW